MIYAPHGFLKSPSNSSYHNSWSYKIYHELRSDENYIKSIMNYNPMNIFLDRNAASKSAYFPV